MYARLIALTLLAGGVVALPSVSAQAAEPNCGWLPPTIVGTAGDDRLVGTPGPDVIAGGAGNDVILGEGGSDLICGGAGDDQLFGGTTRVVDGEFRADVLYGGGGDDLLDIGAETQSASGRSGSVSFTSSPDAVVVDLMAGTATGEGVDTIVHRPGLGVVGSAYADVIDGTDGDDELFGYLGNDRVRGLGGDDFVYLDSQDSEYVSGSNDDWADGGPGDDIVGGSEGADTLRGGPGDDQVSHWGYRPSGPSQLFGDAGDDELRARLSDEHMLVDGGPGLDDITFKSPASSPASQRRVTVRMVPQTVGLGPRALTVGRILRVESIAVLDRIQLDYYGTPRADRVYAGKKARVRAWTLGGADVIRGSGERDFIDSGAGADAVRAGLGRDTCLHAESQHSCEVLSP